MRDNPRILVAPVEIAGYYGQLVAGLRTLGSRVEFVARDDHAFAYQNPSRTPSAVGISRILRRKAQKHKRNSVSRFCLAVLAESLWNLWAVSAVFRYRVFIFGFGQSLMRWNLDLFLLHLLRRRIIVNLAHGAEARPPFMDGGREFDLSKCAGVKQLRQSTLHVFRRVSMWERFADVVIGAPFSTSQFASKAFVNIFVVGLPTALIHGQADCEPLPKPPCRTPCASTRRMTVALHAPSDMKAKGTEQIRRVVAELNRGKGTVKLREIHGRPNHEVRETLMAVDFVIDQLYSDTPLAGFASEAASFGKASVVGGYGLETLKRYIPAALFPPSRICQPDNLLGAVADMAENPELLQEMGEAARAFVESKWAPAHVAARFLCLIEDRIPSDWYLNPYEIIYVEGAGQQVNITQERIRSLVNNYGVDALCVSHKPDLRTALLRFAFGSEHGPAD